MLTLDTHGEVKETWKFLPVMSKRFTFGGASTHLFELAHDARYLVAYQGDGDELSVAFAHQFHQVGDHYFSPLHGSGPLTIRVSP